MAVTYTTAAKVRALVSGNSTGLGYLVDSIIETFINRAEDFLDAKTNHAWRERAVSRYIHDLSDDWRYSVQEGRPMGIHLHRAIRPFRAGVGGTATGGSTTTVIDTVNLTQADDFWNNWYLTFTTGPNEGQTRKVTDFVAATDTATVDALPYAVASGDKFFIGDGVEVWDGSTHENWVLTRTMGQGGQFWLDPVRGMLYLKTWPWMTGRSAVRVTYRYGESVVPLDIEAATTMLAAVDVVAQEGLRANMPGGEGLNILSAKDQVQLWRERVAEVIERRAEWVLVGAQ